jgi:hypothetical protein
MAINKDILFSSVIPEEDVELDGKGIVRVRALTRDELHRCSAGSEDRNGKRNPNSSRDAEQRMVMFGMIDPALNISEVKEWAAVASAGEFQRVVKAIMRLSSIGDNEEEVEEAKSQAYDDFR